MDCLKNQIVTTAYTTCKHGSATYTTKGRQVVSRTRIVMVALDCYLSSAAYIEMKKVLYRHAQQTDTHNDLVTREP